MAGKDVVTLLFQLQLLMAVDSFIIHSFSLLEGVAEASGVRVFALMTSQSHDCPSIRQNRWLKLESLQMPPKHSFTSGGPQLPRFTLR